MRQHSHKFTEKQHNKVYQNIQQYCTEEHLKLHRPEKLCFPFKVERKEGVGRYLVATRDIQPMGESGHQLISRTFTLKCVFLCTRLHDCHLTVPYGHRGKLT